MAGALPDQVRRLAIMLPSWVGDAVMATPVLRAVREHCDGAKLIVVGRSPLLDLLRGSAWIDEYLELPMRGILGPFRAGRVLRATRVDAILLLPNSPRSALTAWLARVPVRIGYDRDRRGRLLTHGLAVAQEASPMPTIEYYALLGQYALGQDAPPIERRMELPITEADLTAAAALLDGISEPFIVLNPGGNRLSKRWPADRFAQVADALAESHGLTILLSGAPGERQLLEEITSATKTNVVNLAPRGLNLPGLKAVLARAALLITNDTGPRHIAIAVGTPTVTLFGPTDHRWTTLDTPREQLVLADPFLPDDLIADRHPVRCAIDRIPVADVLAAARTLLDAPDA